MDELNKSIDSLIEDIFAEPVVKSSENFEVASASKTTADAAIASAPGSEDDESRGAGRPKDDHDVPKTDKDGNPAKGYEAVQKDQPEEQNPEAAKQAPSVSQISEKGHLGEHPKMKDPRLSKSEREEYETLKKAKTEADEKAVQEELKKAEDLKKVEQENLIKSAIEKAVSGVRKENEDLRKAMAEQTAMLKAIAAQPRQSKSVTSIEVLEKSVADTVRGEGEFTKSEKLDAAEALFKAHQIPMEAVIELENTGTILNPAHRQLIEQKLNG